MRRRCTLNDKIMSSTSALRRRNVSDMRRSDDIPSGSALNRMHVSLSASDLPALERMLKKENNETATPVRSAFNRMKQLSREEEVVPPTPKAGKRRPKASTPRSCKFVWGVLVAATVPAHIKPTDDIHKALKLLEEVRQRTAAHDPDTKDKCLEAKRLIQSAILCPGGRQTASSDVTLMHGPGIEVVAKTEAEGGSGSEGAAEPLIESLDENEQMAGTSARGWFGWLRNNWFADFRRVFGVSHDEHNSIPMPSDHIHIRECVLSSRSVRDAIKQEHERTGVAEEKLCKKAARTYDGMSALISLRIVRIVAWLVAKTLATFYPMGVQVDRHQVERLRAVARKHPIVLLPTHRSHLDYLLLGYMCLLNDLPIPHTVAGENLNIPIVGTILRRGGAFFIRRSFRDDRVYSAIFNEYCVQLLKHGFTVECFVEGTRSRSGKVLPPKTGFLLNIVDAIESGTLDDVYAVPINIAYDRIVEHKSYIDELSGAEKEPERLRTFLSSVTTLISDTANKRLCFGRIDIGIDEPFSIREFIDKRHAARSGANGQRSDGGGAEARKRMALVLGYRVLWGANRVSKMLPTSLVGTILLTQYERGIHVQELVKRVKWLQYQVRARGGDIVDQGNRTLTDAVNIVVDRVLQEKKGGEELVKRHKKVLMLKLYSPKERMELAMLRNQLIHHFAAEGIMCCSLYSLEKQAKAHPAVVSRTDLLERFKWLSALLSAEFIYEPVPHASMNERRFERVLQRQLDLGVLLIDERGSLMVNDQVSAQMVPPQHRRSRSVGTPEFDESEIPAALRDPTMTYLFLCALLWPFIDSYWLASLALLQLLPSRQAELKRLVASTQLIGEKLYFEGQLDLYEAVAKDTVTNALQQFVTWGVLHREYVSDGKHSMTIITLTPAYSTKVALEKLIFKIGKYKKRSQAYRSRRFRAARATLSHDIKDAIASVMAHPPLHRS